MGEEEMSEEGKESEEEGEEELQGGGQQEDEFTEGNQSGDVKFLTARTS